ncbi:COP9 signalosome complex subunit 6-like isoform X2 [Symsagittifera roscoffensis]|uniref:COP9 signalosome complex subunit 6-like isoform X2 n=1 Tax=Symsagittifera roscoffensis TaxID=84072 RepID=UPI00307B74D1
MDSIVSNTGASSGDSVKIHPLVILNISDHFTRVRAQNSMQVSNSARHVASVQVYGALYGKQDGRKIEMSTSFELCLLEGTSQIDMGYYQTKAEKFKEVFGDLECLGWYTTGGEPDDEHDSQIHRQFMEINENPVLLKLSPLQSSASELPLTLWEGCVSSDGDKISFLKLPYALATDEAERIGVDHVARVSTVHQSRKTTVATLGSLGGGAGGLPGTGENIGSNITVTEPTSTICDQYMGHHSAVKMLHSRVRLILDYIRAVQRGELGPADQETLREINSLCHTLPLIATNTSSGDIICSDGLSSSNGEELFKGEFVQQYNEVALLSFLGTVMKGCNTMNQYAQKFSKVYDQPLGTHQPHHAARGRHPRGMFM